ncbi:MAG: maltose-binding periplasmic protein [Polaromonas sp.]|nr:maltose-binding periplasmic protein [Polaromonas sp.]
MTEYEFMRVIRLLEQTRMAYAHRIAIAEPDPTWQILVHLLRGHLRGQLVTMSSLATIDGFPKTTAMRRIHHLIEEGYIVRTPRSKTGKSYGLQPDQRLLDGFIDYANDVKSLLARTVGARSDDDDVDSYYFGGTNPTGRLAPPQALTEMLTRTTLSIRFLVHHDNYFEAMRNVWSDFRTNLASRANFKMLHLPYLRSALVENGQQQRSAHDVVVLNMPWLGEAVAKDLIRPLDELLKQTQIDPGSFNSLVWQSGRWRGRQYGIPLYCTVEVFAVRKDLASEAGIRGPQTFDETVDAAKRLNKPSVGRYGILWNAGAGGPIASSFMHMMGCCGQSVLNVPRNPVSYAADCLAGEQLRPCIDGEAGREVLDYMHRLVEFSPPDILSTDSDMGVEGFLSGRAAMIYCWTMRATRFEYEMKSVVRNQVAYLQPPRGSKGKSVSSFGGFLLAIPTNLDEDRARLAIQAVSWMSSPQGMGPTVRNGFPVAPAFSVSADPEAMAGSPIISAVDTLAKKGCLQVWQRPAVPEFNALETVLGLEIHRALRGECSDANALRAAQDAVDRIMRKAGHY